MQSTLAFAPTDDDLDEFYFDLPLITLVSSRDRQEAVECVETAEAGADTRLTGDAPSRSVVV